MKNNKAAGVTTILAVEAAKVIAGESTPRFNTGEAFKAEPLKAAPNVAPDKATALATLTSTLRTFVAAGQNFGDALRAAIEAGATRKELTDAFTAAGVKRGTLNQALARGMANGQWLHLRMRIRSDSDDKAIATMAGWAEEFLNDPVKARAKNDGDKSGDDKGDDEGTDEGEADAATEGVKMTPTEVGTAWLRDLDPVSFIAALTDAKGGEKKAKAWLAKVAKSLGA